MHIVPLTVSCQPLICDRSMVSDHSMISDHAKISDRSMTSGVLTCTYCDAASGRPVALSQTQLVLTPSCSCGPNISSDTWLCLPSSVVAPIVTQVQKQSSTQKKSGIQLTARIIGCGRVRQLVTTAFITETTCSCIQLGCGFTKRKSDPSRNI